MSMLLLTSNRIINYTWTRTFFPKTVTSTMILFFFTGPCFIPTHLKDIPPLNWKPPLPLNLNLLNHDYSILVATNKIHCVLFDSDSPKTFIHKSVVSRNYMHILLDDDLQILPGLLCLPALLPYTKSDSLNSIAIWLLMNTLRSLLTPWVFITISFLAQIT